MGSHCKPCTCCGAVVLLNAAPGAVALQFGMMVLPVPLRAAVLLELGVKCLQHRLQHRLAAYAVRGLIWLQGAIEFEGAD